MKKAKLVISEDLSSILEKYYLTYPTNENLDENQIKYLFYQLYCKGHEDALYKVNKSIRTIKNNIDIKL